MAKVPAHTHGEHPMFKAMAAANGRHDESETDESAHIEDVDEAVDEHDRDDAETDGRICRSRSRVRPRRKTWTMATSTTVMTTTPMTTTPMTTTTSTSTTMKTSTTRTSRTKTTTRTTRTTSRISTSTTISTTRTATTTMTPTTLTT